MNFKERASKVIAQGAMTNSKRPSSYIEGVYPTHVHKGLGAYIYDYKLDKWLDFTCGLGTNLFGHGHPKIVEAVEKAIRQGITYGASLTKSVELAEKIVGKFRFVEKVKYLKSGSAGCSAAVKIARAATGRTLVASEGYHGQDAEFISLTPPALGCPANTSMEALSIDRIGKAHAAVIIEPIITDISKERIQWLRDLRERCSESGTLLIFDETITAYRFPKLCVANYYGIEPDLIVFGKAVAGGLPLSIVGGKAKIMEGDYFVSTTWGDDNVAISAALAAYDLIVGDYAPEHLWSRGKDFLERFNSLCPDLQIEGYPTRGAFVGDHHVKHLFMQEACKAGILFGPSWFYNLDLDKYIDEVMDVCALVFRRIQNNEVELEGKAPRSPFAEKVRKA